MHEMQNTGKSHYRSMDDWIAGWLHIKYIRIKQSCKKSEMPFSIS
jgi:hypothetical protein